MSAPVVSGRREFLARTFGVDSVVAQSGTHLALGRVTAGSLRVAGLRRVSAYPENLAIGPVAADPADLARLRELMWTAHGEILSRGDVSDPVGYLARAQPPVFVWVTPRWRDRLALWSLLHAARNEGVASLIRIVSLATATSASRITRSDAVQMLARAEKVTSELARMASRLWRAYCAATPRALLKHPFERTAATLVTRADLRWYVEALPRARGHGSDRMKWGLSYRDTMLLTGFGTRDWTTPRQWLGAADFSSPKAVFFREVGNDYVLERWRALATGDAPLLELHESAGASAWAGMEARLTTHGRVALNGALNSLDDVPALQIGGYVAYRPPYWVATRIGPRWIASEISRSTYR